MRVIVHRLTIAMFVLASGCAPVIRSPTYQGARDQVTGASLLGPFDGQVVDANTREPLSDVTLVAVWTFQHGDGLVGAGGSETYETLSDRSGRYRIPPARLRGRDGRDRLVAFTLSAYKRGYAGYRSDTHPDGGSRQDFVQRHNKIELGKWRTDDSHAEHLFFLTPARTVGQRSTWEADLANLDFLAVQTGAVKPLTSAQSLKATPGSDTPDTSIKPTVPTDTWLDASNLISAEEVLARTGVEVALTRGDLTDLPRSAHYHGVHFQAQDQPPTFDLAFRVWHRPPDLQAVEAMIMGNMPGAKASTEVTEKTWTFENDELRAIAFVDPTSQSAVLLTCGVALCSDRETALILGKLVHARLDRLSSQPVQPPNPEATPNSTALPPSTPAGPPAQPSALPAWSAP